MQGRKGGELVLELSKVSIAIKLPEIQAGRSELEEKDGQMREESEPTLLVVHILAALPVCNVSTYPNSSNGNNLGGMQGQLENMMKARQLQMTSVRRVD